MDLEMIVGFISLQVASVLFLKFAVIVGAMAAERPDVYSFG